jgi:YVTN family beta-propeller protein/autotransporter-associated beta strand protein
MVRIVLSRFLGAAALVLSGSTAALAQVTSYAFVPNQSSNNVSVISTDTNTVVATVPVGSAPLATAVTPDGRRVYVTNLNGNTVSVIDTATRAVVGPPIPVGVSPSTVAITPDGKKAYVGNSGSKTVSVIDLATDTVATTIALPPANLHPVDIAISSDGVTAYVALVDGLLPIDVATDTAGVVIPTGGDTKGVALHFETALVPRYAANDVLIVDLSSNTVVGFIPTGPGPYDVAISPDGAYAYIVDSAAVRVVDTSNWNVVTSTPASLGSVAVAFAADGSRAYVVNPNDNAVHVMNVATHGFVGTIPVGGGPWGTGGSFISPNILVLLPALPIAGDADLTAQNFRSFVPFNSGRLQATADWTTTRTMSLLSMGGTIDTNGFNVTLDGPVINDGVLKKIGAGTLTLSGTSTHAGGTQIEPGGGTVIVEGTHSGLVQFSTGGTLRGSGTVGGIVTNLGTIAPGGVAPGATTGILRAGNVSLFGLAHVDIELKGGVAGSDYDRLEVSGTAALENAYLDLSVSGFSPASGQQFTIVTNATGIFRLAPDGWPISGGNDTWFRISYTGGDGNDVVLTADVHPPEIGGLQSLIVDEDAGLVSIPFTVSDDAFLPSEIETSITTVTNPALLSDGNVEIVGTGASRTVQMTVLPNVSGHTTVAVRARDRPHRSTFGAFYVMVNPVNDAPTISAIGAQSVPENTPLDPIAFTVGDIDNDVDTLTVTATSSNQSVVPDANLVIGGSGATRTIAAMPAVGVRGDTTITLTVSDGAATTTTSFTLSVVERTYYLAEGATGVFFDTDILLANPNSVEAPVVIRFLTGDGVSIVRTRTLPPTSRTTIRAEEVEGLEATMFATIVTSTNALPIVVERTMRWDASGYGAHTEKATAGAAPVWYFAEGSQGFFSTFFLLANPHAAANVAHVSYFREGEPVLERDYDLAPGSRKTIDAGADTGLINRSFGARVTFDLPGVAERAMYFGRDPQWVGGHAAAGTTMPATNWFLAEGATGSYFTTFLLLANPNDEPAHVTLTYFPASGEAVTKTDTIPAHQRMTRNIATEDATLASAAVATRVESTRPIIAERSQYWGAPAWLDAHNSPGVTSAHTRWGLAEGRVGGADEAQTYILLANPNTGADADVTLTFLRADGTTVIKTLTVPSASRFNVAVLPGAGSMAPELTNESFGAIIESTHPIVVERSVYTNANGVTWAAGTSATATRLP